MVLNFAGFFLELAGGLLFGSVALLSDAVHMLFDAVAYTMALVAAYLSAKHGTSAMWTYGLHRLEPFSAFLNGILLLPMVGGILYESYHRFLAPPDIGFLPTITIAILGLLINIFSVYIIHDETMNLNEKGAFYHLLGDSAASLAVIISTIIIEITGLTIIDPLTAALIALLIVWSATRLLTGSVSIFLQSAPIQPETIRDHLTDLSGVDHVIDIHTWQVCSELTVATVHVDVAADTTDPTGDILDDIHGTLDDLGVDHATVELHPDSSERTSVLRSHTH